MFGAAFTLAYLLSAMVYLVGFLLSKKTNSLISSSSPFECGITSVVQSSKPVSLRFFLLSVVFLIFDVELLILYPVFVDLFKMLSMSEGSILFLFLIIITWGLFWEWARQLLEWSK